MDFALLKKNRKQSLKALQEKLEETTNGKARNQKDERFWSPVVDKVGNGYAVIRFLPPKEGDLPYVRLFSHGFKGPTGQWYIENSRTTIEEADPVGEMNSELWNDGDQETARKQKRRLHFISNVLIVKDPENPENEGKVMLFKFGKKIFEKLNAAMNPEFEDEKAMNPFDMWEGADFRLKIRKYEGYRNYDKSDFADVSAIAEKDDDIKAIWEQTHNIDALVAPDQFKSYDDLKKRLDLVLGNSAVKRPIAEEDDQTEDAPAPSKSKEPKSDPQIETDDEEDLDALLKSIGDDD